MIRNATAFILGVVMAVLALCAAAWMSGHPWLLALFAIAGVAVLVLLIRGVRRDPGFVSLSGYEWHRQTPDHVRDPGTAEGTVLPDKRLPRGR
jgi:fatty acid desaturase